jgi:hypothetical protein
MSPFNRPLALATSAATLVVGAVIAFTHFSSAEPPPSASAASPQATPPREVPAHSAPPRCTFKPGDALAYAFTLQSSVTQHVPNAPQPMAFSLSLRSKLSLEVLSADAERAVLVARYDALSVDSEQLDRGSLVAPFLIEVDSQCQLTQFARHVLTPKSAARNQQALLWEAQFRAVVTPQLIVQNGNGEAVARVDSVSEGVFRRSTERYTTLWATGQPAPTYGLLGASVGQGPWFDKLDASERLSSADASMESTVSLTRISDASVFFTAEQRQVDQYDWQNLLPYQGSSIVKRPVTSHDLARRKAVAGLTMARAFSSFDERVKAHVGIQSTWPELAAYFEVHPDALKPAMQEYLNAGFSPDANGDFFLAIGKTRNDEARELLFEVKRDEKADDMDRVRAMFGLVVRDDVGAELAHELHVDFRRHAAKNTKSGTFLATESLLALGVLAGSHDDPKVSKVATQALSETVREALPFELTRATLKAIGNTGEASLLSVVTPLTQSPDVRTRQAATGVFLRMPPSVADPVEVAWLRTERNRFVRNELYHIAQQQHFNLHAGASRELVMQALVDLKTTASARARRHILRLVAQSEIASESTVREALKAQAKFERAKRSPLFQEFANLLSRDEVAEVLK